jgi:hypothetical protein
MIPIGRMAGGPVSMEQALERLKKPGGEKTLGLIGPGAKQRYMDAKALVDHMTGGLSEAERVKLAGQLVEILEQHTRPEEGEVQHFVLLALGRVWQVDPKQGALASAEARASKEKAAEVLTKYFDASTTSAKKAAILSLGFWGKQEEARKAIPALLARLEDSREDVDVRIASAASLGSIASPADRNVVNALKSALNDTDPKNAELVWNAAMSLARFNDPAATETILMLLTRSELAKLRVLDRETDPKNPKFRNLNELEQQRFLIVAMEPALHLDVPEVRAKLKEIAEKDPSPRVRAGAVEVMGSVK